MPRLEKEPILDPDDMPITKTRAWGIVADFIDIDLETIDIGAALEQLDQKSSPRHLKPDRQHDREDSW